MLESFAEFSFLSKKKTGVMMSIWHENNTVCWEITSSLYSPYNNHILFLTSIADFH